VLCEPREEGAINSGRLDPAADRRRAQVLEDDPALGRDRRLHRHPARGRRRHGRWSSYAAAKRFSKETDEFGKGSIEGMMAAETGDNAAIPGRDHPGARAARSGLGARGGADGGHDHPRRAARPMLMVNQPQFAYDVVAITLIATLCMLIFGLVMVRPLMWVLRVPRAIIMPVVFVLCTSAPTRSPRASSTSG
jgi:hypothetical protein